jgi:WD40 repeat protein
VLPHENLVWRAVFNADGTRLATASFDGTAKLWALSDNDTKAQELATFTGSTAEVSGVAISPDGKYVATVSWDGSMRVYLTRIEDLVALAKTRVTRSLATEECQKYLHMDQCPAQ